MGQEYATTRQVQFRDTDAGGIMHFSAFFTYMEEAEHEMLRSLGLSVVMEDEEGKISWPRVAAQCDFVKPVRFEDTLEILVSVERLGSASVRYRFTFRHHGQPVANGGLTTVCCRIRPDKPPSSIPIPPAVRQQLSIMLGGSSGSSSE